MNKPAKRPVFLNVARIAMPLTALVSIAHRLSGVLLFLALPLLVVLLDRSLRNAEQFASVISLLTAPMMSVVALLILWAIVHHFFAGLRYLALDVLGGTDRRGARNSAWLVFAAEVLVLLGIIGCWL